MTVSDPALAAIAERVVGRALSGQERPREQGEALESLYRQLEATLSEVVGEHGFAAVVARAVHECSADFDWLRSGGVEQDPTLALKGMDVVIEREGLAVASVAATAILERILALLGNFIGPGLTLRLVGRAWPALALQHPATGAPAAAATPSSSDGGKG
jgi:hypothetical protein